MAENSIQEWLAEFKSLGPTEVHSYASSISHSHELIHAIFNIIEDKTTQHELLEPVCIQLFNFYRSHEVELQYFVIQYVPVLIGVYLATLGQPDVKTHRIIEVLILGIYNLDVVNAHGKPRTHSFQLPSLSQPSIYHESLPTITTTDHILRGMDRTELHVITLGPFPQVETLNGQNRLWVLTILMNIYNSNLSYIPKSSLRFMCKICSRLVKQGFARQGHLQRSSYGNDSLFANLSFQRTNRRVPLSSALLLEYLHAIYFAMYNGFYQAAVQALEDVHTRATFELFFEVLLVTNAIKSSLKLGPTGQALEGPMGINVALSPSTPTPTLSKAIITNASFRTKKLPDDIPIQSQENEKPLTTISEEQEETSVEKNEKPGRQLKVKVSMGNLIAKAKGKGKDDTSPSTSTTSVRSKERLDLKKKVVDSPNDSATSIKTNGGKNQINDTADYSRLSDAAKINEARLNSAEIPGTPTESESAEEIVSEGVAESPSSSTQFSNGIEIELINMRSIVRPVDIKISEGGSRPVNGRSGDSAEASRKIPDGEIEVESRRRILNEDQRGRTGYPLSIRHSDPGGGLSEDHHRWADERIPSVIIMDDKRNGKRKSFDSALSTSVASSSSTSRIGNIPRLVETRRKDTRGLDFARDQKRTGGKNGVRKAGSRKSDSQDSPSSPGTSEGESLYFSDFSQSKTSEANGYGDGFNEVSNGPMDSSKKPDFYKSSGISSKKTSSRMPLTPESPGLMADLSGKSKSADFKSDPSETFTDSGLADLSCHTAGTLADISSPDETTFGDKEIPSGKAVKFNKLTDDVKAAKLQIGRHEVSHHDRYDTSSMEMKSVSSSASKPEFTDSSEETEPSYSLDISNSCSNETDSEEDIPVKSKVVYRKGNRESIHTFV